MSLARDVKLISQVGRQLSALKAVLDWLWLMAPAMVFIVPPVIVNVFEQQVEDVRQGS